MCTWWNCSACPKKNIQLVVQMCLDESNKVPAKRHRHPRDCKNSNHVRKTPHKTTSRKSYCPIHKHVGSELNDEESRSKARRKIADIKRREKIAAGKSVSPSPELSEGELVQSTGGETAAPNMYQSTIPSAPRSSGYNTEQPVTGLGQTLPGIALLNPPLRGTQAPLRSSGPSAYNPHDLRIPQIQPGGSHLSAPTPGYQQSSYTTDPAAYASGPSLYEQGTTTPYGRGDTNPYGQGSTNQ